MQTHQPIQSFRKIAAGSNRTFGLAFGFLFAILGVWPWIHRGESPRLWLIILSAAVLTAAVLRPHWLAPLNRAWFKLGLALNMIVSPVVMALLFFGAVMPIGLILRIKGSDLLHLRKEPESATYWTFRQPPGPAPDSMTKQF